MAASPPNLESLWAQAPTGARRPEVEAVWGMVSGGWAQMSAMPPEAFLSAIAGMAEMFDQASDQTAECDVEEAAAGDSGHQIFVYAPKCLAGSRATESAPCLVYYHGGGFIAFRAASCLHGKVEIYDT